MRKTKAKAVKVVAVDHAKCPRCFRCMTCLEVPVSPRGLCPDCEQAVLQQKT